MTPRQNCSLGLYPKKQPASNKSFIQFVCVLCGVGSHIGCPLHFSFCTEVSNKHYLLTFPVSAKKYSYFSYFSTKIFIVDPQKKHLVEALLMSTHNICFHREIRKSIIWIPPLIWSYVSAGDSQI